MEGASVLKCQHTSQEKGKPYPELFTGHEMGEEIGEAVCGAANSIPRISVILHSVLATAFVVGSTETQKKYITCPKSHSQATTESKPNPNLSNSRTPYLPYQSQCQSVISIEHLTIIYFIFSKINTKSTHLAPFHTVTSV